MNEKWIKTNEESTVNQEQELSELAANSPRQTGRAPGTWVLIRLARNTSVPQQPSDILQAYDELTKEELESKARSSVWLDASWQKRGMGKASFAHIQDLSGKIQIYVRQDSMPEAQYAAFDIARSWRYRWCQGVVFKTKTGETSVKVHRS